ncbi:hypothetical protein LUZ60_008254 [Juncus effusus]|nr:hypothetical protein LUZ60_008254 [Juncus effusus]
MTGGVGEMIASAVVKLVAEKLGGSVWTEIGVLWNVQNDLEQMKETLLSLQAVVKDTEMRALKKGSESERIWLQKVKSAVYDIEDALNDFEVNLSEKMDRPLVDLSQKPSPRALFSPLCRLWVPRRPSLPRNFFSPLTKIS